MQKFIFNYFPASGDFCSLQVTFANTVWTRIRPNKTLGLICLQNVQHADGPHDRCFHKKIYLPTKDYIPNVIAMQFLFRSCLTS